MTNLDILQQRIYDTGRLEKQVAIWRFLQKKIVFTNGCFDLIHPGHISYLSQAADLGDVLIIGLNTDTSVRELKGKGRPVIPQEGRALTLSAMRFVDAIVLFDEPTPIELIRLVQPDILVKGKDYKTEEIVGYDFVIKSGGNVVTIDLLEGYSTTAILDSRNSE
ncbi:MAG: D-glycero-beta-D-manno-heptose 1-phosphate adenylyltransferase [Bacteroidales bacterium]|jgi:rfaE bifunctional protein nucleotidyltransferase chain/domain|nr:D-glycero-beta-D-manno-heptose 1-phosphate adenylyltransferase [Bacteroidales bacterium]MDD3701268.1 D-glycero-beta-D-manno-heptose 1-phosphate adenylyltransferase [Bacteroidales bacterium]MDY0368397.1 D-glycero-beta-D-manno-heptose 1-phosphate adenylyltransferase [Bacteroidales bacterium]